MHALIVVAHPNPKSLTHSVAAHIAEGVSLSGPGNSHEIADLTSEAFDPRFTTADLDVLHRVAPPPADVAAEQARIDRADDLVLVFPVYWWSMPGLLKGWIDRVFANGWAFDDLPDTKLVKRLRNLRVHLIAIAGVDAGTFDRHGYFSAMKTQIDHGIFDYCGARVVTSEFLLESETQDPIPHLNTAHGIGRTLFNASKRCEAADIA